MQKIVRFIGLCVLLAAATPASAGVLTGIPGSAVASPKAFWSAVMQEFYGPYSKRQKCWLGTVGGVTVCMRPHLVNSVAIDGVITHFVVTGGYAPDNDGSRADCHACSGRLGLIVLRDGDRLELVARNDLAEEVGSWGTIPAEDQFRLQRIGPDAYGWTMRSGYTGQGYTGIGETVYGLVGDKVVDFGFINTHSDNGGACGDGMGACYEHDYELLFDPRQTGNAVSDIIVRKLHSSDPDAPASFAVPFDAAAQQYQVPEAMGDLLGI